MKYEFTNSGAKDLERLPLEIQKRIFKKLDYFTSSKNPLIFAENLINFEIGQYRFRIGDYRVIFDIEDDMLVILSIGHRREIYK